MTAAQTTDGFSFSDVKVEVTVDGGTTWTDVSGFFTSLKVDAGKRKIGEVFTAKGDTPIITSGKRESSGLTISTVYTEETTDPFSVVFDAHQAKTPVGVRWQPKQGVGAFIFTASPATIESCGLPEGDVEKGDPIVFEWSVKTSDIVKSAAVA